MSLSTKFRSKMQISSEETPENSVFTSLNKHVEEKFSDIYARILNLLYKSSHIEYGKVCKALRSIRKYISKDIEVAYQLPEYDKDEVRCAYIFTYCIIHSVVMYNQFLKMLSYNPSLVKKIISVKEMRLCILGGGPGFEAAAICILLCEVRAKLNPDKSSPIPLQLHVTLIDNCAEWESEAKCILNFAEKILNKRYLNEINFNFIKADLEKKKAFSTDVLEAIKKAHFVTMFKFVSEVCHRSGEEKMSKMILRIFESMSYKSCLFILDNAGGSIFINADKMIEKFPCSARIYGPCRHDCEKLNPITVEQFSFDIKHIFRTLQCTTLTTSSCSAWLKVRPPKCVEKVTKGLDKQKCNHKKHTEGDIKDEIKNAKPAKFP